MKGREEMTDEEMKDMKMTEEEMKNTESTRLMSEIMELFGPGREKLEVELSARHARLCVYRRTEIKWLTLQERKNSIVGDVKATLLSAIHVDGDRYGRYYKRPCQNVEEIMDRLILIHQLWREG